ncbi:hypothetical protein ACQEVF_58065 [Nonomuraea polychroma]|uniref:hypothetical protein n=1 Tax=Nonomuraea polychroma TaxID=46176 RepID=UPI003D89D9A4
MAHIPTRQGGRVPMKAKIGIAVIIGLGIALLGYAIAGWTGHLNHNPAASATAPSLPATVTITQQPPPTLDISPTLDPMPSPAPIMIPTYQQPEAEPQPTRQPSARSTTRKAQASTTPKPTPTPTVTVTATNTPTLVDPEPEQSPEVMPTGPSDWTIAPT